ncbi:chorismate-binding protein [Pseudonocardia dioxanivorans]|uniref:chorismate-binding protein n=1 Tax=Pseudonocardia dioxanivorans TaxID=240495 RepID=UPI000CD2BDDC|nr:chorismate-binding protein [Pseudonocardia dioxanivorans]
MSVPWARFDDLCAGVARLFPTFDARLVAARATDVPAVLQEVDRLTTQGSWACGFVAYEAAPGLDPDLETHDARPGLPVAWFGVSRTPPKVVPVIAPATARRTSWAVAWDEPTHRAAVEQVRERIAAGETYQCNLTTRMNATVAARDATTLYAGLAHAQGGAHNALLDTGSFIVACASPELFVEQRRDRALMRPMKGTAPRGRTRAADEAALRRLFGSEKERAENIMIVDLVRNDLARLAVPGTVRVERLLTAERYATVHQLTSDVAATLRRGTTLLDLFRALFPSGSVTGAPKARTMRLIRQLEDAPRGVYCGAVGVVAPPATPVRSRFSVAIRTVVLDKDEGTATYGTGGGITWSSDPASEYAELLAKAQILERATCGPALQPEALRSRTLNSSTSP